MMNRLEEFNFSDSVIASIEGYSGDVIITIIDWQELRYQVVFKNVIGVEAYSPEGVEVSHIAIQKNLSRIKEIAEIVEEDDVENISQFSFFSSWTDEVFINIFGEFQSIKCL